MEEIYNVRFFNKFCRLCDDSYNRGWNEANGGNLSYRMSEFDVDEVRKYFSYERDWQDIGVTVENLAGEYFMVTGSGKYFKNTKEEPNDNVCIIEIDSTGTKYRIVWGLVNGGRPTSELPTHLMNHSVKKDITKGKNRVIFHNHPIHTISLSFVLDLDDRTFTRELWDMMPECPVVFPRGVGVVGWHTPGSIEIAEETAEKMKRFDVVVWAGHGVFCAGESFDRVFGILDTVEKAATILCNVKAMGGKKWRVTKEQVMTLYENYGIDVDGTFFD